MPAEIPSLSGPEPALPPSPAAPVPQAQGADLAERARFVALSFAFPESGLAREAATDWPLHMSCAPTRFTLTLRHAALRYRLEVCNRGAEALGPLIIRADLIAESGIAAIRPVAFAAAGLPPCHHLDSLAAGENVVLTGELRLALAGVVAMRLGGAELLVPLMRVCAESAVASPLAFCHSAGFAIGLPPLAPGGSIQPFRLNSRPGIWRKLTARRLNFVH